MKIVSLLLGLMLGATLSANNIQVSNVVSLDDDGPAGTTNIFFDLSWENSWRTTTGPSNWDAAWVFVKYRTAGGDWQHVTLSGKGPEPSGATVTVMDGTGAMVYRSAPGTGAITFREVRLLWDYAAAGISRDQAIDLQVFAIEMVFVPEGDFFVGDGNTAFFELYESGTGNQPYQITSEDAISVGTANGELYYQTPSDQASGDQLGPIPATFPKGHGAFYVAKYETSQREWVDFFNTLPVGLKEDFDIHNGTRYQAHGPNKANNRVTAYDPGSDNLIDTNRGGEERGTTAMNYVNQRRALAYLDWAGLRPWTELEFEKAARGPLTPIAGEYASGSDDSQLLLNYTFTNEGQPNSRITNLAANRGHFVFGIQRNGETETEINGPLRVGITAASAQNKTRLETGAGYYGAIDLSGNLWERIVTIGTPAGRTFVANHGDGTFSATGLHNVPGWPAGEAEAYGLKGCAYVSGDSDNTDRVARCAVSARRNAAGNRDFGDHDYALFRGVRSL